MLLVLLNWCYITFISFPLGFLVLSVMGRAFGYRYDSFRVYLWAGLVIDTIYAQVFSLFGGVGLIANIILFIGAIASWICMSKKIKEEAEFFYKRWKQEKKWFRLTKAVLMTLGILLTSYGASRGYMAYDTALYHAQAIRWIEEYGVVKGLGLLHNRFAYNSASFALSALFSFSFIPGVRIHGISGYFLILLFEELPDLMMIIKRKNIKCSDFIRIGAFYYYTLAFGQIVAPASDFPATIVIFYIILRFVVLLEKEEQNSTPYSLLCVLAVYGITMKLSVGLIVLLTGYPLYLMIRKKEWKRIFLYLGLGIAVVIPFLIRGVLISGYLLYPQTVLDIFAVDWKIPKEAAQADMMEIQRWGRNLQYQTQEMNTLKEWVPGWFMSQDLLVKIMLSLDALGLPAALVFALTEGFIKKKRSAFTWLFLWINIYLAAGYWFISAPLVRYGYAYVIIPFLSVFGYLLARWKKCFPVVMIVLALFAGYKILALGKNALSLHYAPFYVAQQPYEEYETIPYQVGEYIFYIPANGDQTGYEKFPASPFPFQGKLKSDELKDGFIHEIK